jgi:hypothetical protein
MERGGWARPLFDDEALAFVQDVYQRADAFLFGRRTYELFAVYWGVRSGDPISDALNARPKYVASTRFTNALWADTTSFPASRLPLPWTCSSPPGFALSSPRPTRQERTRASVSVCRPRRTPPESRSPFPR